MFSLAAKEAEDRLNGPLKLGLRNICLKSKKLRKLIRFFINISGVLVIHDHLVNLLKQLYTQKKKKKKSKRKVQGVPQSQTAALPRPQEEEESDKSKQAQTEQTYEKH